MTIALSLAMMATPAAAQQATAAFAEAAVAYPGKRLVLQSTALGHRVVVRVADDVAPHDGRDSVTAYLFATPAEARLVEAVVRERRLDSASYGAVTVSIEAIEPVGAQAPVALQRLFDSSDPLSAKFEAFVVEELRPFIAARWPEKGPVVVAGSAWGGQFALHMVVHRPGFASKAHVETPTLAKGVADRLIVAQRAGEDYVEVDLNFRRADLDDPDGLERLVASLEAAGTYMSVNDHEQTGDAFATGTIPAATRIGDFIISHAMVPPR